MKQRLIGASVFGLGAILVSAGVGLLLFPTTGVVSGSPSQDIPPFTDYACLDCHTDEARLKEFAAEPEEPEESLSSGPG
ncbi:MAG: hypothetical protein H6672_12350 [Anaerolineaceae bacterium]|nr:hypothetical protein [Anaerolineaceae bacterium]